MADNYLERRMDDLRSGRLAASNKPTSTRQPKGRLAELHAVITGSLTQDCIETASALRSAGASVDIIGSDSRAGNAAAQKSGAKFHLAEVSAEHKELKEKLSDIIAGRGSIDILLHFVSDSTQSAPLAEAAEVIVRRDAAQSAAATYAKRFILIAPTTCESTNSHLCANAHGHDFSASLTDDLRASFSAIGFSVSTITPHDERTPGAVARAVTFLCERTPAALGAMTIETGARRSGQR